MTDYELGVVSAIEADYPNIKHYGCFFQFSTAIYRKNQGFGLATAYRENPLVKISLQKFIDVPFLMENLVSEMLVVIFKDPQVSFTVEHLPTLAVSLREFHRALIITFAINMWNVFERPSRLRTTNCCKGWNNAWNMHTRRFSQIFGWLANSWRSNKKTAKTKYIMCFLLSKNENGDYGMKKKLALKDSLILGNLGII